MCSSILVSFGLVTWVIDYQNGVTELWVIYLDICSFLCFRTHFNKKSPFLTFLSQNMYFIFYKFSRICTSHPLCARDISLYISIMLFWWKLYILLLLAQYLLTNGAEKMHFSASLLEMLLLLIVTLLLIYFINQYLVDRQFLLSIRCARFQFFVAINFRNLTQSYQWWYLRNFVFGLVILLVSPFFGFPKLKSEYDIVTSNFKICWRLFFLYFLNLQNV